MLITLNTIHTPRPCHACGAPTPPLTWDGHPVVIVAQDAHGRVQVRVAGSGACVWTVRGLLRGGESQ